MIGLIRADDLDRWASRITSAREFPRLVRRLVHSTGRGLGRVGFSAWELGTSQDPRAKANDDYTKRSDNPAGVDPTQATFIFVTPRRWPARDAWIAEKRAERKWQDVLAFDAESLAQWLESAPGVAAWFGQVVGAVPTDVRALEEECETFKAETKPACDLWTRAIRIDSSAGVKAIAAADRSLIIAASGELQGLSSRHHRRALPGGGGISRTRAPYAVSRFNVGSSSRSFQEVTEVGLGATLHRAEKTFDASFQDGLVQQGGEESAHR